MIIYPPAKINIGLSITEKRMDGFHNIETVFYPIPLCDILEITPKGDSRKAQEDSSPPLGVGGEPCKAAGAIAKLDFTCSGIELPGDNPQENLCCKAYHMLDADYNLPPVMIRLHKTIPTGAGLGGGSSDAAYTLQSLNDLFQLRISDGDMARYANQLGSDCAFFLQRSPAFGTGKGNILEPVALSLAEFHILLVKPPVFVSTADAYSSVTPQKVMQHLPELLRAPVNEWRHTVFNDFEESVFKKFPGIGRIKEELYREGAVYAAMSGSGSSVYGIFREKPEGIDELFPDCFVWNTKVSM